jgi:hypothetical protein
MTLVFTSCDPGRKAAKVAKGRSMDALTLALSRTYLSVTLVKEGAAVPVARCAADRLVRVFTIAELNDPKVDPKRVAQAIGPCRQQA